MKFYFPDSQDMVSPTYDFINDEYAVHRVRQRDDLYAHEVVKPAPYDGILVSKAIVDGSVSGSGKYTTAQRERLHRLGVNRFFRLPDGVDSLGDCGAFNYVNEELPPYTVGEVLDFYEDCSFDAGVSVDHVVLAFDSNVSDADTPQDWKTRREISLRYAEDFLMEARARNSPVIPYGAAQGWSPASYSESVERLQAMGYRHIAIGGMVPLRTKDILSSLRAIDEVRDPSVHLHLLGITRVESMEEFSRLGVRSFDSTSPFRQAFMDDRRNYHTLDDAYVAIRVPQVDGNAALKRLILSGAVSSRDANTLERACMEGLRAYDRGKTKLRMVLGLLEEYEGIVKPRRSYLADYERTLSARPWKFCGCSLCSACGIDVAIFRGTERNKRRGFHNIYVFEQRVRQLSLSPQKRSSRAKKG